MKTYNELYYEYAKKAEKENRYRTIDRPDAFGAKEYYFTEEEQANLLYAEFIETKERIAKEEERKKKAEEKKIANAKNLGMTIEEYNEMKKRKAKVTRYKKAIRQAKEDIEIMEEKIKEKYEEIEEMKKFIEENT